MANQKDITLRQGEASPNDTVLHDLPVADLPAQTTIYLSEFDATPKNVVLRGPTTQPQAAGPVTIIGTMAATDASDTAAFAGDISHAGTLAATDGADAAALEGDVVAGGVTITGDLAATDAADSASMAGVVSHVGTLSAQESGDTFAAAGDIDHEGDVVASEAPDTAEFVGDTVVLGWFYRYPDSPTGLHRRINAHTIMSDQQSVFWVRNPKTGPGIRIH